MEQLLAPLVADRSHDLAESLVETFGGLNRALSVDPDTIIEPDLRDACKIIQAARKLTASAMVEPLARSPVSSTDGALVEFLRTALAGPDERLVAVFLDDQGGFLCDELLQVGHRSEVRLEARRIFSRAFGLGAGRLIIAHNHPSGDHRPSETDLATTRFLAEMCGHFQIVLDDHLIFSSRGYFSFRKGGLL